MDMFDEARSIKGMLDMRGLKQGELAKILGVSQPYIANKLRLLGFSGSMEKKIRQSNLTERHARALLKLPEKLRPLGLEKIVGGRMTVAQSEIMVDCLLEEESIKLTPKGINAAERVGRFEELLDTSLANLRLFGIRATAKREKFANKLYVTICIE